MPTEMVTRICQCCGREIQVPSELTVFSCVYCGRKLNAADYLASSQPVDDSDRAYVEEYLLDCVRNYPNAFQHFNRKQYETYYQSHKEGITPVFEAMNRYVCAQPMQRQALLDEFAGCFVTQWEELHNASSKAKTRAARERKAFSDKLTLAWFTVPAILELALPISEEFVDALHSRFNARFPDNTFEPGTHAEISGGFRKHGACFITTAVCEAEGKPDDCPELTAFRAFRDGWLAQTGEGQSLIRAYYEIAPAVVAAMRYGDREQLRCAQLRQEYLNPCYEALLRGDEQGCLNRYCTMIRTLQRRYGLS